MTVAARADYVFYGEVSEISECVSADGTRPWNFVRFSVLSEIIGSGLLGSGEPVGTFSIRLPAGTHSDHTSSAIVDTPVLAVGDRLIVPVHAHSGTPGFLPILLNGDGGYFRVFPDAQGGVVLTSEAQLIQETSSGNPLPGLEVRPANQTEPGGSPVDITAVETAISQYRTLVAYDGQTVPTGEWTGRLRVTAGEPVYVFGVGTFQTDTDCNARLSGSVTGNTLTLTGSCNADHVGRVDVTLTGARSDGRWGGTLRLAAGFGPALAGVFTWSDHPWSTVRDFPDAFTAHTTGVQIANSVPQQYLGTFSLGENPAHNVDLIAAWNGVRAPMTIAAFESWLEAEAARHGNAGRIVHSVPNHVNNCVSVTVVSAQ